MFDACCIYPTKISPPNHQQENPAVARENALQPIQFLLQYGPSRSSKVDDFVSSERAYAIPHWWLIVTQSPSLTVSEIWPVFR